MKSLYLIKKLTLYNQIIKLKSNIFFHVAVWCFYVCEISVFILTLCETIFQKIDIRNGIVPDYILDFSTDFLYNQLIGFMLLGFFEIILFIVFCFLNLSLIKKLLIKSRILNNNVIYHMFWIFGIYITIIIIICTLIYIISISMEGFLWLIDSWQH